LGTPLILTVLLAMRPLPAVAADHRHLHLQRARGSLALADDARRRNGVGGHLTADHLGLALRPQLLHRGEEVDGLQEVGLSLGVRAYEHAGARSKGEVQTVEVAVIGELETEQPHGPIIADARR